MNKLEIIIHFINNSTVSFRMKDIKNHLFGYLLYDNTTSNYVNQIYQCGYIKRINRGVYIKVEDIPTDLTASKLRYMAYDKDYRLRKERKLKIEKLRN